MSKEAKLGLFVVIVVAVFMFFTINMGALFFKQGEKTFQIYFDSVGTLEEGAPVKQAGLDVGFVEEKAKEIVYNPTKSVDIVVTIRTNEKADIAVDSKASIQTMGMMGEKYIELTFGTSPVSATEATRIEGQGPVALDNVMENAVALTNEVQTTVESLNEIFGDEKFKNNLLLFVGNMESFSEKLNNMMGGERQRLQTILTNIKTASADLSRLIATAELFITDSREMVNENRPAIHKTLANTADISETLKNDVMDEVKFTVSNMNNTMIDVKEFVADLRSFSSRLNTSVDKVDGIIAKVDGVVEENKPDIKDSFSNLKKFSENASQASDRIDNLLKQIQDRDGLIHKVIYDEEMAESTKKTIAQTEGVMNTFSTFPDRLSLVTEFRGFADEIRFHEEDNYFRADMAIQYDFTDKLFMQFGGNNLGASNGIETQIYYQLGRFFLHGGVIESEVGAGVDWQVMDRWLLGMEAIGLTDNEQDRLDFYSEIRMWEDIYLIGGIQDLTNDFYPNGGFKVAF